jgi:hypothetical protein
MSHSILLKSAATRSLMRSTRGSPIGVRTQRRTNVTACGSFAGSIFSGTSNHNTPEIQYATNQTTTMSFSSSLGNVNVPQGRGIGGGSLSSMSHDFGIMIVGVDDDDDGG